MLLKKHGKSVVRVLLHQAGALRWARYWHRQGIRILMYHDFPSIPGLQDALRKQCAHIARYYNVVTLTDIGRHLREGTPLPKNALAVTVDDGNRDFLLNGYPVFHAHKIPVSVFLVSGFLDGQMWLWWDQVIYIVEKSPRSTFNFSLSPGHRPQHFSIETPRQRQQAITTITEALKALSRDERMQVLNADLANILEVKLPQKPPQHMAPMTWAEVRHLAENGVDVGAHTVTHPVLSSIRDPEELLHEIEHSKRRIEEELRRPILHFCYPYGRQEDFNDQTLKIVEQCKFQTAVTAQHGMNNHMSDPFQLTRLSVDPMLPEYYFRERVAGLHAG